MAQSLEPLLHMNLRQGSFILAPMLVLFTGCLEIIDAVALPSSDGGGGTTASTGSVDSTSSGGSGGMPASGPCDVPGGLQAGSPWPMLGGCPTHRALSAFSGAHDKHIKWSVPVDIVAVSRVSLTLDADGTIYVPAGDSLVAFHPDGTQKWSSPLNAFEPPAIAADGTLYAASLFDNQLHALDPSDGSIIWSVPADGAEHAGLAVADDGTIVVPSGSDVIAVSPAGSLLWTVSFGSFSLDASPAIAPTGTIYVASLNPFRALHPSDGSVAWTHAFPVQGSIPTPTVAPDGTIYIADGPTLHALSPAGTELWSSTPGTDPSILEWVAIGPSGALYVVDTYDGAAVYALSPVDGSVDWAFNVGGNYGSAPVVGADGILYVSLDEALYAFRPDGTQLWAFQVGAACGTPAIGADGTTYVVCGETLYALTDAP